jgi:hypothetical protein
MSGDHYGLKIVLDSPIVLSDFLDGIGYPIDGATSICLSVVIAHKDDGYLEHGASVAQYLLNQLLGISATQLIFSGEGSSAQIVLDEMMYIDWSFFNKIYKSH